MNVPVCGLRNPLVATCIRGEIHILGRRGACSWTHSPQKWRAIKALIFAEQLTPDKSALQTIKKCVVARQPFRETDEPKCNVK